MNENLSGSWYVAPTVSEDAGKTTQPGDKRSGCWTRCKTRRRYTPIVIEPEISTGHHNKPSSEGFLLAKYWRIHMATPKKKHLTKLAEAALHKLRKAAKLLGLVLFINTVK